MDLDSLWMVHWEDRRTVETGSHAGVSVWRRVLCGIARMSCLPEFLVNNGLKCLNDLGRSPSASESAILVDPGGMFPSSDLARMRGPAPPAGSAVLMGPVADEDTILIYR